MTSRRDILKGATAGSVAALCPALLPKVTAAQGITWPHTIKWATSHAPVMSGNDGDMMSIQLTKGGDHWYAAYQTFNSQPRAVVSQEPGEVGFGLAPTKAEGQPCAYDPIDDDYHS